MIRNQLPTVLLELTVARLQHAIVRTALRGTVISLVSMIACSSLAPADPATPSPGLPEGTLPPPDEEEERLRAIQAMSLEDIINTPVTSPLKRPESRFDAAAAIHVITNDDIRRSGARSFPEALRLAPGLFVAQVDANKWSVGSRGFADLYGDTLLVLVDGRSIYSAHNSGVYWSIHDYLLEDVERIEVIRGPGGTLWGSNAVNGVINVITKSASKTQGLYMETGVGTHYRGFGGIRYGHSLGDNGFVRGYLKYQANENYEGGFDEWDLFQTGFRADWEFANSRFTFSGDMHQGESGQRAFLPNVTDPMLPLLAPFDQTIRYRGGNLMARYEHTFSEESDLKIQAYWDHFTEKRFTWQRQEVFDFDFQHRFPLPFGQNFMYGVGYQYAPSHLRDNVFFNYDPNQRGQQLFSAFVQDEITLVEDRLRLIVGSKIEHNDFTGWELQPNARLVWKPAERQTVWAAVSRAVQVPLRSLSDLQIPLLPSVLGQVDVGPPVGPVPVFGTFTANDDLEANDLIAYELGYRIQPEDNLSFDLSLFYNDYQNLIVGYTGDPFFNPEPGPHLAVPVLTRNAGEARSFGGEIVADWQPLDWLRFQAQYSYIDLEADDGVTLGAGDRSPRHMASLRSTLSLPGDVSLDIWGRYVDSLPAFGVSDYLDLDLRLAWRPNPDLEIALVGQNLLSPDRIEFGESDVSRSQVTPVPRGGYLSVSMRF